MSEKYFNAYVDSAVGMIHEYVASNLQLKAQLRVANDTIVEKDNHINTITAELQYVKEQQPNVDSLKADAKHWQDSYHAVSNKVSHMETLTAQYNDLKNQFLDKCSEVEQLKSKITELENSIKTTKKVINNKTSALVTPLKIVEEKKDKKVEVDDF